VSESPLLITAIPEEHAVPNLRTRFHPHSYPMGRRLAPAEGSRGGNIDRVRPPMMESCHVRSSSAERSSGDETNDKREITASSTVQCNRKGEDRFSWDRPGFIVREIALRLRYSHERAGNRVRDIVKEGEPTDAPSRHRRRTRGTFADRDT